MRSSARWWGCSSSDMSPWCALSYNDGTAFSLLMASLLMLLLLTAAVEPAHSAAIPIACGTLEPTRLAFGSEYVASGCTAATPIFLAECPTPGSSPPPISLRVEATAVAVPIVHLNCTAAATLAFISVTWSDINVPYPTANGRTASPWEEAGLLFLEAGTVASIRLTLERVTLYGQDPAGPEPGVAGLGLLRIVGSVATRNVTVVMGDVHVVARVDVAHPAIDITSATTLSGIAVTATRVAWASNAMVCTWGDATVAIGIWLSVVSGDTVSDVSVSIRGGAFVIAPCEGSVLTSQCQALKPVSNRPSANVVVVQGSKLVSNVAITAIDATWTVAFPDVLLNTWQASSAAIVFYITGSNFNDAAGMMRNVSVHVDNNTAITQSSYFGAFVYIGNTFHAQNEVVSIFRSTVTTIVTGLVSTEIKFRNADVVRICDNQGNVGGVVVLLEDLQVAHRVVSGLMHSQAVAEAAATTFLMAGAGSQVLTWVSDSYDVRVTMRRVHFDADIRNGTFPPAGVLLSLDLYSCALSASLIQVSDAKTQSNAVITVEASSISTKTGTSLLPLSVSGHVGVVGYVASLSALMRLSNTTNCSVDVADASVRILGYYFLDHFPVQYSEQTKCYVPGGAPYLNGRNITSIVGTMDLSMAERECENNINTNPLFPKRHTGVRFNIVRSTITYYTPTRHPADLDCIVCLATFTSQAHAALTDVVSIGTPIDPIGCGGCSLVDAVIWIRRGRQLATLLRAGIMASTLSNVTITAEATQFQPPASQPAPGYVSLDPLHAIRTSASLTMQKRVHIALIDCELSARLAATHMAALVDTRYVSWGGDPGGGTGQDAAFVVQFTCATWNGSIMAPQHFNRFVTNVVPTQVVGLLNVSRCPNVPTPPPPPPSAAATTPQAAAANGATGAVVVGGAMVAVFAMPAAMGSVPALQASAFAVRLGRACAVNNDDTQSDDTSTTLAPSPDDDEQIGTEIADNPLQLTLGGDLSYAGGAVVGNAVLVVCGSLLLVAAKQAMRIVSAVRRGDAWRWVPSLTDARCDAVSAAIPLYGVVLQPTTAAGAQLIASTPGGSVALGTVAIALCLLPGVWSLYALRRHPALVSSRLHARRPQRQPSGSVAAVCGMRIRALAELQWRWAVPRSSVSAPSSFQTDALLLVLEPYRGGDAGGRTMFVLEAVVAVVQGTSVGVAVAMGSCAAATGALWVLTATSVILVSYTVLVRPYAATLDAGVTVVLNALSALVGAVSLAAVDDDVVTAIVILQAALSIVVLFLVVGLFVMGVVSGAQDGTSERRRGGMHLGSGKPKKLHVAPHAEELQSHRKLLHRNLLPAPTALDTVTMGGAPPPLQQRSATIASTSRRGCATAELEALIHMACDARLRRIRTTLPDVPPI